MPEAHRVTQELKRFCLSLGISKFGVADLSPFQNNYPVIPGNLISSCSHAISLAIALDNAIIDGIESGPTTAYAHHYVEINARLDQAAAALTAHIKELGFHAQALPASQFADPERLMGHISHKAVARMAGIGWQGKSLLIVSPEFGPRIRLVTVITDMPLQADSPLPWQCGKCTECTDACPVGAIRNTTPVEGFFKSREDAIDLQRCYDQTMIHKRNPDLNANLCGLCMHACPWGVIAQKQSRPCRIAPSY